MDNSRDKKRSNPPEPSDDVEYTDEVKMVPEEAEFERAQRKTNRQREELSACLQEKQEYLDGWQRARADLLNARKQFEAEKRELVQFAKEGLIFDMLGALDSFDMAFSNREAWERVEANWRSGIEYIYQQLLSTLEAHGVTQFSPLGEKFNPSEHESMAVEPVTEAAEAGKIVHVLQKGYRLHGKVIRAAKVKVSEYSG